MRIIPATTVVSAMLAAGLLTTSTLAGADDERGYRRGGDQQVAMMRGGMGGERFIERMADRLDLTDEQLTSVRAIFDTHRDAQRDIGDRLRDGRREVEELMKADTVSPEAIREVADAQGQAMADLIVLRATIGTELKAVLTPEQREALNEMREERRERRGHRRGRRNG